MSSKINIRKLYHSSFIITYKDGTTILTDPFFGKDTPPNFKLLKEPKVKYTNLPKIDVILVTHEHFDHFDKEAIEYLVNRDGSIVVAPYSVMEKLDIDQLKQRVVKIDDSVVCAKVLVKVLPAQHSQSFYPVAYMLIYDDIKLYFAGDTMNLPDIDFDADIGIMPAGGTFTADMFVFVSMARRLNLKYAIPMHYNTFNLIEIEEDKLIERCSEKFKETKLIIIEDSDEKELTI